VNGFDVVKQADKVRHSIGVVFQDPTLDSRLTARENLEMHAAFYGVTGRKKKIDEVLDLVGLREREHSLVKTYSGGMRRRLEIARGLVHEPNVLFLDEPTLGLDPQSRNAVWEYIKKLISRKKITILLTTHYMEEADLLCNRVGIIDLGKIIALDTPSNLKDSLGGDVIYVGAKGNLRESDFTSFSGVKSVKKVNGRLMVTVENAEKKLPSLCKFADSKGIKLTSLSVTKPSLNDVFLHYTGKQIRAEEVVPGRERMRMMMMRGMR
jgi:ABC-2 type transport system ATP-binding protein